MTENVTDLGHQVGSSWNGETEGRERHDGSKWSCSITLIFLLLQVLLLLLLIQDLLLFLPLDLLVLTLVLDWPWKLLFLDLHWLLLPALHHDGDDDLLALPLPL